MHSQRTRRFAAVVAAVGIGGLALAGCTGDNKASGSCEGDKACTDTSASCAEKTSKCCAGSSKAEAVTTTTTEQPKPAN